MDREAHRTARRRAPAGYTLLLSGWILGFGSPAASAAEPAAPSAPDFVLPAISGGNLRLSEFRGDVVLLNFWAGWCGRCQQQLPALASLQARHAGRGVRVLAVNIEADDRPAHEAVDRLGLTVLHDRDQAVARRYDLDVLPLMLVIDPHGAVRHVHGNYRSGDEALYDAEITALLNNNLPPVER